MASQSTASMMKSAFARIVDRLELHPTSSETYALEPALNRDHQVGNSICVRRIVHLAKHCSYGNGNVHVAVDLACVQADSGCDVTFVSSGGTFVPMLQQHGIRHIHVDQNQRQPLSMLNACLQVVRLVKRVNPNILHAHMMGGAVIGWVASIATGVPLVTTVHNSFDRHSRIMRLGRRVVAVSAAEKDELTRQGYAPDRIDVVMNAPAASPREKFMRNDKELTLQSPCILTVCGLHRRKGIFDLLDACAVVFKEIPEWRLYIAGEGPDLGALQEHAATKGIAKRVTFLGFVPAPRPLLEKSDIFTLCSYADPCSLVIGEARAAGCAIIATAVGGTPEMLEFGRAGRLVPPGRSDRLAAALRELMTDPIARSSLRRASQTGSEVFNVHRLIADYDRVYRLAGASQDKSAIQFYGVQ